MDISFDRFDIFFCFLFNLPDHQTKTFETTIIAESSSNKCMQLNAFTVTIYFEIFCDSASIMLLPTKCTQVIINVAFSNFPENNELTNHTSDFHYTPAFNVPRAALLIRDHRFSRNVFAKPLLLGLCQAQTLSGCCGKP